MRPVSAGSGRPTTPCSTTQAALDAADPGQMLRATASAGAQVRESASLAAEADSGR